jgi:hypothetical protein
LAEVRDIIRFPDIAGLICAAAVGTELEAPEHAAGTMKDTAYAAFMALHLTPSSRYASLRLHLSVADGHAVPTLRCAIVLA